MRGCTRKFSAFGRMMSKFGPYTGKIVTKIDYWCTARAQCALDKYLTFFVQPNASKLDFNA